MFIPLDRSLYSDCKVVEIPSCSQFFYPIFKNGSSSLTEQSEVEQGRVLVNDDIRKLTDITVVLRDPVDRLTSGIDTLLYFNREYDVATMLHFFKNYLFLDKHILPQFNWLLNLGRFTNENVRLHFVDFKDIPRYTNIRHRITPSGQWFTVDADLIDNQYLQLDTILYNLCGSAVTFNELLSLVKNDKDSGFEDLRKVVEGIANVLSKA